MIKKLKGLYIILLFAILIFAYYGYRYFDRPKNVMTLNEVLDLVDSSHNYYNFRVKYTSKSSGSDGNYIETESNWYYYKDGYFKYETEYILPNGLRSYLLTWQNSNENGYTIQVDESPNIYHQDEKIKNFYYTSILINYLSRLTFQRIDLDETYDYKYIGEEDYNGQKCVVVEIDNYRAPKQVTNNQLSRYRYYISKESGFILYYINEVYTGDTLLTRFENKYTIEFDVVTGEDVKEPKPEDYPDFEVKDERKK